MSARDDDKDHSPEHTSQGLPTNPIDAQEPFSPFDEAFVQHLRRWRSMESRTPTNVLSPLPTGTVSADELTGWLKGNISTISSILQSIPHIERPSAFDPPTFREPGRETERIYTTGDVQNSFDRIMNLGFSFLDTLDQVETKLAMPATAASPPTPSSPTTSTRPVSANHFNPHWLLLSSILNTLSSSPAVDPDDLGDFVRTNEDILKQTIVELAQLLETATEHSLQHTFTKSLFGLMALFLYELNRDDEFLDAGIASTATAFARSISGPSTNGGVDYMPIFVRCWAYGQRLKAQRDNEYDILDVVVDTSTRALEICDKQPSLFAPRAVKLLSVELSECFLAKYRATGDSQSLDHIIDSLLKFTKDPSSSISSVIGNAYLERFRSRGDISDLDNCLQFARRGSMTLDHAQLEDLDAAIVECQNAISQLPTTHFLLSIYEADLADCLSTRFLAKARSESEPEDIDEDIDKAFEHSQSALSLLKEITPAAMPPKVTHGLVLTLRGAHNKNYQDLSDAIRLLIIARKEFFGRLHLESHIEYNLSRAFQERYRLSKEEEDLDLALHHANASLQKAEPKAPRRGQFLLHRGQLFAAAWKYNLPNRESHISSARETFMDVLSSSGTPLTRLQAAMDWTTLAETAEDPGQALEALQAGLSVLPELVWIGHKMSARYDIISSPSKELSRRAATHAIGLNNLDMAVQVLESGRSIIWSQALRSQNLATISGRDSYEATLLAQGLSRQAHDETTIHSSQLQDVHRQLPPGLLDIMENLQEAVKIAHQRLIDLRPNDPEHLARVERHLGWLKRDKARFRGLDEATSLRSAAQRLEKLQRDRTTHSTAFPPELGLRQNPQLLRLLRRGTIVALNIHGTKCDAIILSSKEAEITLGHIPLPNMSAEDANEFGNTLRSGVEEMHTDSITPEDFEQAFVIPVLQELWNRIVDPILEHLGPSTSGSLPRIWWYPTGPLAFLPIHAAGPYTDGRDGLPELSISSYISSIQSLLQADSATAAPFHMLAIGQPEAPGQPPLPAVDYEMEILRLFCKSDPASLTALVGQDGNIHAVKEALPKHTWLHFSGHAIQDQQYPFDSALHLHDGPLKLAQLMQLDLSTVQFAFLSACMTSQGDQATPDESIHLAAGLQFAGARSVIGTMWSVDDSAAALASREVYKHLLRNGLGEADPREAGEALHIAMKKVKDHLPLYLRVPIMHTGL